MRALDPEAMHGLEFPKHTNVVTIYAINGELCVGMQFRDKEAII